MVRRALILALLYPALQAWGATCTPVVEARPDDGWMRVRPHEDAFTDCTLDRDELARLLRGFLQKPEYAELRFRSLFLGRLVDHPWLARHLAQQAMTDARWDGGRGMPRAGDANAFVGGLLSSPASLALLQQVFTGTGYTVTGISVEKVLVDRADAIAGLNLRSSGLVPYDALAHVTLEKN